MARQQSIESRIKEHLKYREQCRRGIRPAIQLFLVSLAVVLLCACFLPFSWLFAGILLGVTGLSMVMEIFCYWHNGRMVRRLSQGKQQSHEPGK